MSVYQRALQQVKRELDHYSSPVPRGEKAIHLLPSLRLTCAERPTGVVPWRELSPISQAAGLTVVFSTTDGSCALPGTRKTGFVPSIDGARVVVATPFIRRLSSTRNHSARIRWSAVRSPEFLQRHCGGGGNGWRRAQFAAPGIAWPESAKRGVTVAPVCHCAGALGRVKGSLALLAARLVGARSTSSQSSRP